MNFQIFGNEKAPTLLLIPGLGVSYEIFLPLIQLTEDKFRIIAAEVDGYKSVYTNRLEAIHGADIHYWYGTKEAFVAKPQVEHLLKLCPSAHVEVFNGMNHGQLLIDHPVEVAKRIIELL